MVKNKIFKCLRKAGTKIKNYRKAKELRDIWLRTMVFSGVTVGTPEDGTAATFDLLNIKINDGKVSAISLIPYGLKLDDLLQQKSKLENSLNGLITIKKDRFKPQIFIEILLKAPRFNYEPVKTGDVSRMFVGYDLFGRPQFANLDISSSFLIAGTRGTGKTVYTITLLVNAMLNDPDAEFIFLQICKSEMAIFDACDNTKCIAANIRDCLLVLRYAIDEMNKRAELFKKHKGLDSFTKYNRVNKKNPLKHIYIICEEMSYFADISENKDHKDYKLGRDAWDLLKQLAKYGRSCGIILVGVVQRSTKSNLNSDLKSQMNRITFKQMSKVDSISIIDDGDATNLKPRELYAILDEKRKLIAPTVDENYNILAEHLPELKANRTKEQEKRQKDFINSLRGTKKAIGCDIPTVKATEDIKDGDKKNLLEGVTEGVTERVDTKSTSNKTIISDEVATARESKLIKNKRDKDILKFIETYGAVTVRNVNDIFYPTNKTTESARHRLTQLVDAGELKSCIVEGKKQKQYYITNPKSVHDLYVIEAYSKLIKAGCKIREFKLTPHLSHPYNIIPDSFIQYEYNGSIYNTFLEIDYTHETSQEKINIYENYKKYENLNFNVLILKFKGKIKVSSDTVDIFKSDIKFSNIADFLQNKI